MNSRIARLAPPGVLAGAALLSVALAPGQAAAAPIVYEASLTALNASSVSGFTRATLDGNMLTVRIEAAGLEPNQPHPAHIHGRFDADGDGLPDLADGTPIDSFTPTGAQDTDGDSFIEVLEGLATYGPVILPLTSPPGSMNNPTADGAGMVLFEETYDLTNDALFFGPLAGIDFEGEDVLPLDFREFVIHGRTVAAGIGAGTPGEVDGTGGFLDILPVASGEFVLVSDGGQPVPEPASAALVVAGLAGMAWMRRRRAQPD